MITLCRIIKGILKSGFFIYKTFIITILNIMLLPIYLFKK